MTHVLRVDTFEAKPYPIVRHEFRGETRAECMHYYQSHLKTDAFLAGCARSGRLGKVECRNEVSWYTE
jgi:hypothetical protein